MNRFRKPDPGPQVLKYRCEYIGDTSFEVEAETGSDALEEAENMLREAALGAFCVSVVGTAHEPIQIGPQEWHAALKLVGDFDRIATGVGSSRWWLTNGHVALLGHGPQPSVKAYQMVATDHVAEAVIPTARGATTGDATVVRLGPVQWVQERYLWLVEELFGECDWHETDRGVDFVAKRGGRVVAVVMQYRFDDVLSVPFVPAAEESAT